MKLIGDTSLGLRSTGSLDCTYHYYLSGNSVVGEQNGSAQSIKDHVWGLTYIDEALQTRTNTNPTGTASWSSYWLLQDANYNVLGVVDSSGLLTERYEYTAYGQRQVFASARTNDPGCYAPLAMSGRVVTDRVADILPARTKKNNNHQKGTTMRKINWIAMLTALLMSAFFTSHASAMYNPTLGRFMQQDPMEYVDGMNPYAYESNAPLSVTDSFGTQASKPSTSQPCPCWCKDHPGDCYLLYSDGWIKAEGSDTGTGSKISFHFRVTLKAKSGHSTEFCHLKQSVVATITYLNQKDAKALTPPDFGKPNNTPTFRSVVAGNTVTVTDSLDAAPDKTQVDAHEAYLQDAPSFTSDSQLTKYTFIATDEVDETSTVPKGTLSANATWRWSKPRAATSHEESSDGKIRIDHPSKIQSGGMP